MSASSRHSCGIPARFDLRDVATRIGKEIAEPAAADVDRHARFPREAIEAIREERLLGAGIPADLGGLGCSISELAAVCEALGRYCASTAMVFAMHQIQVASIVRHAACSDYWHACLSDLARRQGLIASVTSEVGVGGDMRSSLAAVETDRDRLTLCKDATTISYGAYADALLVTARRSSEAAASDQVLVLLYQADYALEQTSEWDTFGMRGTCSPGFKLRAQGATTQILPTTFADIATQTMVPYSHLLWCSCWTGIAKSAVSRASRFVRASARSKPGALPPTALRLAGVSSALQAMEQAVHASCAEYERLMASPNASEALSTIGFALQMNNLKVSTSQLVAQIVTQCLGICGISGYKNDSPFSLGRHLRDAHSAALMIGNDRILATNASLLLVHKDD